MRTIIRGPYYRLTAWLCAVALTAALLPAPTARAAVLPRVAVVQVTDTSGAQVQNLGARMVSALSMKLFETGQFEVIGLEQLGQAAGSVGITGPVDPEVDGTKLSLLAAELGADFLIFADLTDVQVDVGQQLAAIGAQGQVYDRLAQGVVTTATVNAFNVQRTQSEAVLVDDALDQTAFELIKTLVSHLALRGRVLSPPLEDHVQVSFAQPETVRLGAMVSVLREGLLIARVKLEDSLPGYASGVVVERIRPELSIRPNDEVVLYRQGDGRLLAMDPDADPNKDRLRADERGRSNATTLWAVLGGLALIALGVWAVTAGNESRSDARTPQPIAPTNGAVLRVDAINRLVTPVDFVVTATKSTDTVTFQIATDRGFTALEVSQSEFGEETAGGGGGGGGGQDEAVEEPSTRFIFTPVADEPFLAPGTYFWRVIASSGTEQHISTVFTFTVAGPGGGAGGAFLRSPDTVNALSGNQMVEVQWTPVAGAQGFQVFRRILTPRLDAVARTRTFRPGGGTSAWVRGLTNRRSIRGDRRTTAARTTRQAAELAGFSLLAETDGDTLSYTDAAVLNGTEYQWLVLTKDAAGQVTPLSEAQATSFATSTPLSNAAPAAPSNLTAIPGDGQVILTWTQPVETDLAGVQIFRATSANGNFIDVTNNLVVDDGSPAAQALSAGPGDVSVTDRGLTNGVTVFYRIRSVQLTAEINGTLRGGLTSGLSPAVEATPSSAPPQELQITQPPNGSTIDADRPQLAWRGVQSASLYTVQLATDNLFTSGLITTESTETELIYPAGLPALAVGTLYFIRVGVFDQATQQTRFGPTSSFTRGAVGRITTTIRTTVGGAAFNGATVTVDGAQQTDLTPSEVILAPKTGNAPYTIDASFTDNDGVRFEGTASYRPGIDPPTVSIALANVGTAPVAPTGLKVTGQTDRLVLRWNPDPNLLDAGPQPGNVAAEYSIRRRANTEEGQFTEIARVTGPAVRGAVEELLFTDFNVQTGVRYFYRVFAVGGNGIVSIASVTTNGVAGVGTLQTLTPQENQSFGSEIEQGGKSWQSVIDFAWNPAANATRYIFEVGVDPELNVLLEDGNALIAPSDTPQATYTIGEAAPDGFVFTGPTVTFELYWRATAVDAENRIINQTEARRFFVIAPTLAPEPDDG